DPVSGRAGGHPQSATTAPTTDSSPAFRALCAWFCSLPLRERGVAGVRGSSMEKQGSIIYLEDITVSFDGFQVLRGVDFYVDRGELRALIGPNGAGKTTLLDVICGKVKPATGRIIFGDHPDLTTLEEHEIIMLGMGRKFQPPAVFKHLTLVENLTLALHQPRGV